MFITQSPLLARAARRKRATVLVFPPSAFEQLSIAACAERADALQQRGKHDWLREDIARAAGQSLRSRFVVAAGRQHRIGC